MWKLITVCGLLSLAFFMDARAKKNHETAADAYLRRVRGEIAFEETDIIRRGRTKDPYGDHAWIMNVNHADEDMLHVTTDWEEKDGHFKGLAVYDRSLSVRKEALSTVSDDDVQKAAYNAWMDGAHS